MNRPAPPESETPEMTLVEHLRDEAKVADNLSHWHTRDLLLRAATALSLAQTEIKGHMRVEDELKVRIAELEKDAARYRHIRKRAYVAGNGWMFGGHYKPIAKYAYNLKGADAIADCDAAIDAALKDRA